jgi:CheY-like chemotaxis protein
VKIADIVLSANIGEKHRENAFAAGCDACETKSADFARADCIERSSAPGTEGCGEDSLRRG